MGHPVPILATPAPTRTTVYCVLTFWRDRHKLAFGKHMQFSALEPALKAGVRASVRHAGVAVVSISGNPEFSVWDPPRVYAIHGDVPPLSRQSGYLWE